MKFAFISSGKLLVAGGAAAPTEIESKFAQDAAERDEKARRRHGWKGGADQGDFLPRNMIWGKQMAANRSGTLQFSAVSAGALPDQIFYTLSGAEIGGIFEIDAAGTTERRILHGADFQVRNIKRHPAKPLIAYSKFFKDGSSNVCLRELDTGKTKELTEGDSIDDNPSWAGGKDDAVLFHSAGIARGPQNQYLAEGPFCIERLDLTSSEIETVAEDPKFDLLMPRELSDGTLLFIRRPYQNPRGMNPLRVLSDIVLFPFRLLRAVFGFLNFFSTIYSGKPLATVGQPDMPGVDMKRLVLLGRVLNAEEVLKKARNGAVASIVPASWHLVSRSTQGNDTILAKSVGSYDLASDGQIVYSDGSSAFIRATNGTILKVLDYFPMEQVTALS
jgi:hypothetical protein